MELKATSLLLLMCVAVIILSAEDTSAIPTCCLVAPKKISKKMLRAVRRYDIQSQSGRCDIDALILHIGHKKICAHPKLKKTLEKNLNKNHKPKPA